MITCRMSNSFTCILGHIQKYIAVHDKPALSVCILISLMAVGVEFLVIYDVCYYLPVILFWDPLVPVPYLAFSLHY